MPRIKRVGHIVLSVKDFDACLKFYNEVLGMEVVAARPERRQAFLSFGTQHHDIALFGAPEEADRGQAGMHHLAMLIDGGIDELSELCRQMIDRGGQFDHLSDHGMTKSAYFKDPDGNMLEVYCDTMTTEEGMAYLQEDHGGRQPLTLEGVTVG